MSLATVFYSDFDFEISLHLPLVKNRVGSTRGDSARVAASLGDADVTILTPGASPRVLDLPEVRSISAEANGKDTVVEGGTADMRHDTTLVKLPVEVGVNSNGDRLVRNGLGKGILVGSDIGVRDTLGTVDDSAARIARGGLSGRTSVWVIILGAKTVGGDVLESVVHEATVASHVTVIRVARHKLLLGERNLLAVLEVVSTLHTTSGGEKPSSFRKIPDSSRP